MKIQKLSALLKANEAFITQLLLRLSKGTNLKREKDKTISMESSLQLHEETREHKQSSEGRDMYVEEISSQNNPVKFKRQLDHVPAVIKSRMDKTWFPKDVELEVESVVRASLKKLDNDDVTSTKEIMELLVDIKK